MSIKHTPAPWESKNGIIFVTYGKSIATVHTQISDEYEDVDIEAHANAKLIAAAPELLEALRNVRLHMTAYIPEKVFDLIDNAIKKATI